MFEIYDFSTGEIVRKANDAIQAYTIAQTLTEAYMWVNGHTFDVRVKA